MLHCGMTLQTISAALALMFLTSLAKGQPVPTPIDYVSNLDVECYHPENPVPPLNRMVNLTHLNPVLANMPPFDAWVSDLDEVCLPVAKDGRIPPPTSLPFIQYTDLSCYRAKAPTKPFMLNLTQLNPVMQGMQVPDQWVMAQQLEQLCTPVEKMMGGEVPATIRWFVEFVDLACFRVQGQPMDRQVQLSHLNPLLQTLPPHGAYIADPELLCVPVAKDGLLPPPAALNVIQWTDLLKYRIDPIGPVAAMSLWLNHLNPLFLNEPGADVFLPFPQRLGVPVAKNWQFPPPW